MLDRTRPERNTSKAIAGTPCDGCRMMTVIPRITHSVARGYKEQVKFEDYYCASRGRCVDPHAVDCEPAGPRERR